MAKVAGHPGTIVFDFDASEVVVEEEIEIRRWTGTAWESLQTFPADSGEVTWIARNQLPAELPGSQTYRIFSKTRAYIAGQCAVNDYDCDDSNNGPGWVPGERIGFGTPLQTIQFKAGEDVPATVRLLLVERMGLGSVTRVPPGSAHPQGGSVELTAVADTNTYRWMDDSRSATATLSTFAGWGGQCSGSAVTCTLTMNTDKAVTARFDPIEHVLTVQSAIGTTATPDPAPATYTYARAHWSACAREGSTVIRAPPFGRGARDGHRRVSVAST